jgi:hypothetical protein
MKTTQFEKKSRAGVGAGASPREYFRLRDRGAAGQRSTTSIRDNETS